MAITMDLLSDRKFVAAAVVLLLAAFVSQSVYFAATSSYTYDETVSVVNGYYYLTTHDMRLGLSQPPLSAYLSAVPLFLAGVHFDFNRESCASYDNWLCAQQVLFEDAGNAAKVLFLSRIMSILAAAAAGIIVFLWAKRLFGALAGLLSLALFSFNPIIISQGALALTNSFLMLFVLLNLYLFYRLLLKYSLRLFLLFSVTFALAVASKANAALLLPITYVALLLFAWRVKLLDALPSPRRKSGCDGAPSTTVDVGFSKPVAARLKSVLFHAFVFAAVSFFVLLVVYQFQFGTLASSVPPKYVPVFEGSIASKLPSSIAKIADAVVFRLPIPFPSFFSGAAWHTVAGESKLSFLNGEVFTGTKLSFFPVVFFTKTPVGLIVLAALGLFVSLANRAAKVGVSFLILPAIIWLCFFALTLDSGVQHILLVYPLLAILAGGSALWLYKVKFRAALVALLLFWNIFAALLIAPHYLAYFNELAGGPDGGSRLLGVPNFDWGQDLPALRQYMSDNNIQSVKLSYFGTADPSAYGINYTYLASPRFQPWDPDYVPIVPKNFTEDCGRATGIVAISATNYYGIFLNNRSCYSWLRPYQPIAALGHTIFVYNIPSG